MGRRLKTTKAKLPGADKGQRARPSQSAKASHNDDRWPVVLVCVLLVLNVWFIFGQITRHGFVNYDDPAYVYDNEMVTRGLTGEGIVSAFIHTQGEN